jgi:hypothetical protein
MPVKTVPVRELDKGINKQFPGSMVLWSDGRNVRFTPGFVSKTPGKFWLATSFGALPVRATFSFIGTDGELRTIVCCDEAVYAYNSDFTSYTTITPSPAPTGGETDFWQFELVAGLPILSNGKDAIWKWASYAGVLTALTGAPTWAKRISSCLHRLVASNLQEGGYTYTGRVRWTEPGNPENWTIDETTKAGRFDIVNFNTGVSAIENVKAQVASGQRMFFFVERGLWVSDFAQATKQFIPIDPEAEILASRAVCKHGDHIYWLGKKDVFRTGAAGQGKSEPIGLPMRDEIFDNLNAAYTSLAFAFSMPGTDEVWFCVATGSNTVPDTAYIYNAELKVWSIQGINFSCHGEKDLTGIPLEIVGNASGDILRLDYGDNDYFASIYQAIDGRIESGDMSFDNPDRMKVIAEVIPDLKEQTTVCELLVQVGVRNRLGEDIKWSDPVAFTIGVSQRCDFSAFRKEGKWVRFRFYSNQRDTPWSLSGFTINYELRGTR